MNYFINGLFLFVIVLLYLLLKRQVTRFGYLEFYGVLWGILILGSQSLGSPFAPEIETIILYYVCWIVFMLPSFLTFLNQNDKWKEQPFLTEFQAQRMIRVVYVLVLLSVLANAWVMYQILGSFNFFKLGIFALRLQGQQLTGEQSSIPYQLFAKCHPIYLPMAIMLFKLRYLNIWQLILIGLISLTISVLNLTRAPVFFWVIIVSMSVYTYLHFSRRAALIVGSLVASPIIIVTAFLSQNSSKDSASIQTYLFGGVKSFEKILNENYPIYKLNQSNFYSLEPINYVMKKIGLLQSYPSLVREYSWSPFTTNVYTYLDAFTLDYGQIGAIVCAGLYGFIAAKGHKRISQNRRPAAVSYYIFICYAIGISFMNNELIRINHFILLAELWCCNTFIFTPESRFADAKTTIVLQPTSSTL